MTERYSASAEIYDLLYSEILDYETTAERLIQVIRARSPEAQTLLEAACGTGSFLVPLRRQFDVSGFDLSEEMLAVAKRKLRGVELRCADMLDFEWGSRFDALICMFSSVGYLTDLESLERAYRRFAAHLEPNGVLVVEPWFEPDAWIVGHVGTNHVVGGDVSVMRMNTTWLEDDGRVSVMDMHHLVGRTRRVDHFVERHRLSLVTREEHFAAFAAAGLAMQYDPEGFIGRGLYVGGLA